MSGPATPDPKLVEFLRRVLQRTVEGKVRWRPGERDDVFCAGIGNHEVEIFCLQTSGGTREYKVVVLDSEQRRITEIPSGWFSDNPPILQVFRDLHGQARRIAMNADEAIDAMISDLDSR